MSYASVICRRRRLPIANGMSVKSSETSQYSSTTATATVTAPAGISEGDLIILAFGNDGTNVSHTPPAGFTLEASQSKNSSCSVYYKVATASEPSDYSITLGSNARCVLTAVCIGGSDTTPADSATIGVNSANYFLPVVTTTNDGGMFLGIAAKDRSDYPWTDTPANYGYTTIFEGEDGSSGSGGLAFGVWYQEKAVAGNSDTTPYCVAATGHLSMIQLALQPPS